MLQWPDLFVTKKMINMFKRLSQRRVKSFLSGFLTLTLGATILSPSAEARLIFTTEDDGAEADTYTLDVDGTVNASDNIDLSLIFGANLGEALTYNDSLGYFVLTDSLNLEGNELQEFKIGSSAGAPVLCNVSNLAYTYYDTTTASVMICNETSVGSGTYAFDSVEDITAGSITTTEILDGTIATVDVADNAITTDKIGTAGVADANKLLGTDVSGNPQWEDKSDYVSSTLTSGQMLVGNGSNVATGVTLSGDATISNAGVVSLSTDSVDSAEIAANAVDTAELADDAVTSGKILDGTIVGADLAADSITSGKILDGTITVDDLGVDSVDSAEIVADAVDSSEIADDAVGASEIAADAVGSSELADNAVDTAALQNDAVTSDKIADGAVSGGLAGQITDSSITADDLAANSVDASEIATNAVGSLELADNAVDTNSVQDDAITTAKIGTAGAGDSNKVLTTDGSGNPQWEDRSAFATSNLSSGSIFVGNAINNAVGVTMFGDGTIANTGQFSLSADSVDSAEIADDAVGSTEIAADAVTASELADDAVDTAAILDDAVTTAKILDANVTAAKLADGAVSGGLAGVITDGSITADDLGTDSVDSDEIAADAVGASELDFSDVTLADFTNDLALTDTQVFVGNGSNVATGVTISGDATITNTGVVNLATDSVDSAEIVANAVDTAELADSSVTSGKILDGTIATADLANNSVDGTKLGIGTTAGDTMYFDGTDWVRLGIGTAGQVLQTNAGATAPEWAASVTSFDGLSDTNFAGLAAGNITVYDAVNAEWDNVAVSGDATIDATGDLQLAANSVTAAEIATGAVGSDEIADGSITASDLDGSFTITGDEITDGSITAADLGTDSVDSDEIAADAVGDSEIDYAAVTLADFTNDANFLTTVDISDDTNLAAGTGATLTGDTISVDLGTTIESAEITDGTIAAADLAADAVVNAAIADNAVTTAEIGTAGLTDANKVLTTDASGDPQWEDRSNFATSTLTSANIFVGNGSNVATGVALSGDATIDNTGALSLAADSVDSAEIAADAVTASELADDAVDTAAILDDAVTAAKLADGAVSGGLAGVITDGSITADDLATDSVDSAEIAADAVTASELADDAVDTAAILDDAVTADKIDLATVTLADFTNDLALTDTQVFVGNGSNVATGVAISGDATITNTGVLNLATDSVDSAEIVANAVDTAELADSSVNLALRAWSTVEDYWTVFYDITENCKEALDGAGIEIPYPHVVEIHKKE